MIFPRPGRGGIRRTLLLLLLPALAPLGSLPAADTARRGATETALDRYVAAADPAFRWAKVDEAREAGLVVHTLDLVSQQWLTPAEVNHPEWRHAVQIFVPEPPAHRTALLVIAGGSNRPGKPPRPDRQLAALARATRSVVVELRQVPNQPLIFHQDGKERVEDDLIAYTWDRFLRTGDDRWPARLPMTKAAVRAMDAATAFLAGAGGGIAIDDFVVTGASKRGWTTWTTAIVDRRVVGICPLVIDVLNVERSMDHHYRAYGFFAPAVGEYERQGIMHWMGTPESAALYALVDPFSYRDRLALPKLLINAGGDQFFLPDSSRFYFDALPGVKFLRTIPNTDHSLKGSDAAQTLTAWHHALINRTPLPRFTWKQEAGNTLTVAAATTPRQVRLWQATNPAARDFRLEKIGPAWTATPVEGRDGLFTARLAPPPAGWTAYVMELTFDLGGPAPLKLTTPVIVAPDTLPFGPPGLPPPKGFLSN